MGKWASRTVRTLRPPKLEESSICKSRSVVCRERGEDAEQTNSAALEHALSAQLISYQNMT